MKKSQHFFYLQKYSEHIFLFTHESVFTIYGDSKNNYPIKFQIFQNFFVRPKFKKLKF